MPPAAQSGAAGRIRPITTAAGGHSSAVVFESMIPPQAPSPWLRRYATFLALATLGLIGLGGLVTSHGAGMAVPDWPTTYGYNMFLFPISQWVGGIFYEHTHRLYASAVGLLTVILALALQFKSPDRTLVRWGWIAVALVIVQGVLGGLRVSLMKDQIGVLHAALAQLFLVLLAWMALRLTPSWSRWMESMRRGHSGHGESGGEWATGSTLSHRGMLGLTVLIFVQLLVGASMRHQHAGLAVPDFPLAYGRVWPPTDEAFLQRVNAARTDTRDFHPITAGQVHLHMLHRILAVAIATSVVVAGTRLRKAFGPRSSPGKLGTIWIGLVGAQVLLGAITVWSNKAADVATAHVVVGAVCLVVGAWVTAFCREARLRGIHGISEGGRVAANTAVCPAMTTLGTPTASTTGVPIPAKLLTGAKVS